MMKDEAYLQRLLTGWEEVAKHGQLTLWVLLALKDGPKHMADIKTFIAEATNQTLMVDEKSLYRALRRYYDTEMVDYESAPGKGPDRKVYRLNSLGAELLRRFIQRNIADVFWKPAIIQLMKEEKHS
ncbi:MAG: PadR family transcriptional regulator [Ktedonobacteraceae bacterium]|nr:PadR family transcriptional regulator [Ktedonobacteraceae bacterium]